MLFREGTMKWLLDGDPAVTWQVQRDLSNEPAKIYVATQARVNSATCNYLPLAPAALSIWTASDRV